MHVLIVLALVLHLLALLTFTFQDFEHIVMTNIFLKTQISI